MDYKSDIKGRRKARIRNLLEERSVPKELPLPAGSECSAGFMEWGAEYTGTHNRTEELDPEVMWKKNRGGWEDSGDGGKHRFVSGFLRRSIASLLVFGAVWGIFTIDQPWVMKPRAFIAEALSQDMDFEAARVWYEQHFNGAPAFIPMFGDKEEQAQKASASRDWNPPVAGSIIQPFAATLKGVSILTESTNDNSVMVKSVDMGRVLSVTKELQGGIRVTVRHTGNFTAEYGHLSGTRLKVDDWLQSGENVGWILEQDPSTQPVLFFSMMKDKTYIDPAEVISFD